MCFFIFYIFTCFSMFFYIFSCFFIFFVFFMCTWCLSEPFGPILRPLGGPRRGSGDSRRLLWALEGLLGCATVLSCGGRIFFGKSFHICVYFLILLCIFTCFFVLFYLFDVKLIGQWMGGASGAPRLLTINFISKNHQNIWKNM